MSHMSEIHARVQDMLRDGWTPSAVASVLQIPIEWVHAVEDGFYAIPTADEYADADAIAYGDM